MTDADTRRERVKSRIDASQQRASNGGNHRRAPERPHTFGSVVDEHPGLVIAGGLVAGVLLGALLPRGAARKLVQRSSAVAALGAELAAVYGRQALDKAEEVSREGRDRLGGLGDILGDQLHALGGRVADVGSTIGDGASHAGHRAARAAGDASATARDAGRALARKALDLAANARR